VVVDMQNDFVRPDGARPIAGAKDIVPKVAGVLAACRQNDVAVIHVVRSHHHSGVDVESFRVGDYLNGKYSVRGSEGAEIVDELAPAEGEYVLEKKRFSAFFMTELPLILKRLGASTLIVAGVQGPNCLRATVYDAVSHDFDVVLLSDGTASQTAQIHESNLFDMENIGVKTMTCSQYTQTLEEK